MKDDSTMDDDIAVATAAEHTDASSAAHGVWRAGAYYAAADLYALAMTASPDKTDRLLAASRMVTSLARE